MLLLLAAAVFHKLPRVKKHCIHRWLERFSKQYSPMRTGELLVRAARALRAIGMTSLPGSLARTERGQTKQTPTIRTHGYNKKKNALEQGGYGGRDT